MDDKNKEEERLKNIPFVKEVAKYFRDFLETDFHRQRSPKRYVKYHDENNILLGINLNKYPIFKKEISKSINQRFQNEIILQKGKNFTNVPKELTEVIHLQANNLLNKKKIDKVIKEITLVINSNSALYHDQFDKACSETKNDISKILDKEITKILVKNLEKPLENLKLADENNLYLMEDELNSVLMSPISENVSDLLKRCMVKERVNLTNELSKSLSVKFIKHSLLSFFENFKVKDLYSEVLELERNRNILDKQEFYFYFYDIAYDKIKFPIFYIPLTIEKETENLKINFDSQLYINKKALEFINEQYNENHGKKGKLKNTAERIIYLTKEDNGINEKIQNILNELVESFELDNSIKINNDKDIESRSMLVKITNDCYISLFDKSDEALINDYEDILEAIETGEGQIADGFNELIENFIYKDPESCMQDIENEWNDLDCPDKLVVKSPIPLNSEQMKIIKALHQDKSKYIIVEGPPGTGKSHSITAVVFDYILDNKTVLVLSDKKEALDVVEDKIIDTIQKVRIDDKFQNPLLRLGKTGNTFNKILSNQTMNDILQNYSVMKRLSGGVDAKLDTLISNLKESLNQEANAYSEINLDEIKIFYSLEKELKKEIDFFDEKELLFSDSTADNLADIRNTCIKISKNIESCDSVVNLNHQITESDISCLNEIKDILGQIGKDELISTGEEFKIYSFEKNESVINASVEDLEQFGATLSRLVSSIKFRIKYIDTTKIYSIGSLALKILELSKIIDLLKKTKNIFGKKVDELKLLGQVITETDYRKLKQVIKKYKENKRFIIGYFGKSKIVKEIDLEFQKLFPSSKIDKAHRKIKLLENISQILEYIEEQKDTFRTFEEDSIEMISSFVLDDKLSESMNSVIEINNSLGAQMEKVGFENWPKGLDDLEEIKKIILAKKVKNAHLLIKEKIENSKVIGSNQQITEELDNVGRAISISSIRSIIAQVENLQALCQKIYEENENVAMVMKFCLEFPKNADKLGISLEKTDIFIKNNLIKIEENKFNDLVEYWKLKSKIIKQFNKIPNSHYVEEKLEVENLATSQMTFLMDERVVNFWEKNRASARTLRDIIRAKQKFPKEEFSKLKDAFPCILAGIRDYAEYIPLEPELFDLVIIDEASQVSIAQALPALLRAKKILILGDRKQFGNVKSYQARLETNQSYLNSLNKVFRENVSPDDTAKEMRANKFNIKTSVLDFFEFIANFSIQLRKYFRGYKEIISYSNHNFYNDSLQVMKIRSKRIDEVIKFSILDHDNKEELIPKTNTIEINFIIQQLKALKDKNSVETIGIITPHTNQQKLMLEKISELPEKDYYFDNLRLKVMTFDTCQGEERDIIFYSMVANDLEDRLMGIFPSKFNENIDDEDNLRRQRMNVGFSRAKETMHFILSKPIENFRGTIGEALRHYWNILEQAKKELLPDNVDKNSPMEREVLSWFYQTEFWKENNKSISFQPQFELGKYLKQLDHGYNHPNYVVDFLIIYKDSFDDVHKLIMEYDGFKEHFENLDFVNRINYEHYYNEDDLYRQKVLESYGYKFLRINKFNIGDNQIQTLNDRLFEIVKKNFTKAT